MQLNLKDKKSDYIRIRLSSEEKADLKEEAKKRGMTLTDLIKISLNEYLK